jgi:hypothetical protein
LIEAQINNGESIALRVFQYGFVCAVRTRQTAENLITLTMPAARSVYSLGVIPRRLWRLKTMIECGNERIYT